MKIHVRCSGGLGAQLMAICYSRQIQELSGRKVVLHFTEIGNSYRSFVAGDLCTDLEVIIVNKSKRLSSVGDRPRLESHKEPQMIQKLQKKCKTIFSRTVSIILDKSQIRIYHPYLSLEKLKRIKPWTILVDGYHADIRIVKDAWPSLKNLVNQLPDNNFVKYAGSLNRLSVHWRLGDYLTTNASQTHGIVDAKSLFHIIESLTSHHPIEAVEIFTDSPEIAAKMISQFDFSVEPVITSNDIWSDLVQMSKARYFIGSHSSISIFAALAIMDSNSSIQVYFPEDWFKELPQGFEETGQFYHPYSVFSETNTYKVKF